MRSMTISGAALLALFAAANGPAPADEAAPRAGTYSVEMRLDLPHLEGRTAMQRHVVCLGPSPAALPVLSANNPLASCPAVDLRRDGDVLTFDIVCPGSNAARAHARFIVRQQGFRGRIAMTMGGKNMTMTESQVGRRIGTCD